MVLPHKAYWRRTYHAVFDTTDEYPKGQNSCLVLIWKKIFIRSVNFQFQSLWKRITSICKQSWSAFLTASRVTAFFLIALQQAEQESGLPAPRAYLWLPSGTALGEIARWQAGSQTWTPTWTVPPDQRVVKVLYPQKSQHKLCGVSILFKSVTDAKFETSKITFQRLMPSTVVA